MNFRRLAQLCLWPGLGLIVLMAAAFGVRCWNWPQVFIGGQVYFIDADCYSRMTRVQQVMAEPWRAVKFHAFENAPFGVTPHTTAPMDLTIAGLAGVMKLFTPEGLDLAGAFVSPLLGALLLGFLGWWVWKTRPAFGGALLALVLLSPILAHGFLLGRPDHQSLILLLVGMAWAAELTLWKTPTRAWHLFSAICWALALWTSLFEPLILLVLMLIGRGLMLGWRNLTTRSAGIVFAVILLGALVFDGWRFRPMSAAEAELFSRWSQNIGELRHASLAQLCRWTGWLLPVVPFILIFRAWKRRDRAALLLALQLIVLIGLSIWYMRWGYFLALGFALIVPMALATIRGKGVAWALFVVSLLPLANEWDAQLWPDRQRQAMLAEAREDAVLLREASNTLVSPTPATILAPWWLSPAMAYWSGGRLVGGSSHQSLPGTADTARFYTASDAQEARRILDERKVDYVIAYEPSRVLPNSAQILGRRLPPRPLGGILYQTPAGKPDYLRLVYENLYFKIYEVKPVSAKAQSAAPGN